MCPRRRVANHGIVWYLLAASAESIRAVPRSKSTTLAPLSQCSPCLPRKITRDWFHSPTGRRCFAALGAIRSYNPPARWVGTANYRYLFHDDPLVWPAVKNTLWIIGIGVPLQVLAAFGIALMVARARSGIGFFRTIFYLPALAPPVVATLAFVYLLNPATGPVNIALSHLGINGPLWFQSPQWSKPSLVLLGMWGVGNTMIIFLAAILDVPKHLYESAELDGAGPFQRLRWVTLPTISPVILFSVVIGVIQGLQYFTQAYVAANVASGQASQAGDQTVNNYGYPEGSTLFYPVLLYQQGFRYFNMGYASALSILLLGVAFAVTLFIIVNSRRWVHYTGAER